MSRLGELGLSSYEETVYRSLLPLGAATAEEISAASGVPKGRIYDVLNGLAARDIVRTQPTEPTTYGAVEPDVAVERLLAERRRQLDERAERYERIASEVGSDLAATVPTESRFWTVPLGSETAVSLTGDVFERADDRIRSAMGPPYARAAWADYRPEVDPYFEAVDGLAVQCLVSGSLLERVPVETRRQYVDSLDSAEFRVTTGLASTFDLLDDETVCFHVPHPLDPAERLGVIDVRDAPVVDRIGDLFDHAWAEAVPLETVLDERAEGGTGLAERESRDDSGAGDGARSDSAGDESTSPPRS